MAGLASSTKGINMNTFTFTDDELSIVKTALTYHRLNVINDYGESLLNRNGKLLPVNTLIQKLNRLKEK